MFRSGWRDATRQQAMLRSPDLTHAAGANPCDQLVAADLTRVRQPRVETIDYPRDDVGHGRGQVGRGEEVRGNVDRPADRRPRCDCGYHHCQRPMEAASSDVRRILLGVFGTRSG